MRNSLGDAGVEVVMKSLGESNSLLELGLSGNSIGKVGAAHIAQILKSCPNLASLDLDDNSLGDDGAEIISKSVELSTSLVTLSFCNNCCTGRGVALLCKIASKHPTLKHLYLRGNPIGQSAQGLASLIGVLRDGSSLKSLDLGVTSLGDEGLKAITMGLKGIEKLPRSIALY